jgi:hypothetical protein
MKAVNRGHQGVRSTASSISAEMLRAGWNNMFLRRKPYISDRAEFK